MTVYEPAEDSRLFESAIRGKKGPQEGQRVLDVGTGSGILAIAAAKKGCSVTAVDINPEALEAARRNAEKEGVELELIESDLFKNVKDKFDFILFNPPYVPTEEWETRDMESVAWQGGKLGREVIDRFLEHAFDFLKPGGKILLLVSSNNQILPELQDKYNGYVLSNKKLFFEVLYVVELKTEPHKKG